MRWPLLFLSYVFLAGNLSPATATRLIESSILNILQPGNFSATHFSATLTPDNQTVALRLIGETLITGYITAEVVLVVYGFETKKKTINPCKVKEMKGFCPMNAGPLELNIGNIPVPKNVLKDIPGVGYAVPDLDATIRIQVLSNATGEYISTVEAVLSNGQTAYQAGVGWTVAVIAGFGLAISVAVPIVKGYSDAAIRLTAYTLSLLGFIQAQAMVGMLSVPLPPIVRSWTQNFQWSMGVVNAEFLQTICTWYLRSTGGTPDQLMSVLSTRMVNVLRKRHEDVGIVLDRIAKRSDTTTSSSLVVRGLARVAFRAQIEETNLFTTAIMVFAFVTLITTVAITAWKVMQLLPSRRNTQDVGSSIRKGILYRVFFLGFSPLCIFSLWELTQRDSPAEIVVAIFSMLSIGGALAWALTQIILLRMRSLAMHQQAWHSLFTDTDVLHKYGFLYIQYNTQSSFFAAVALCSLLVKVLFISFAQHAPKVQTIAFLIIEPAILITVSVLRPWVDKKTNAVNITIAAINFLNSIFVTFFSGIFGQPQIVSSVMGLILFVTNAALVLILLLLVLFYSIWTILKARDSDARYKPMSEVFGLDTPMQSATRLRDSRELDDLAAVSRGEFKRQSTL
ncbi:hypothetical protein BDV12DRAFT_177798 [Aspergillus spectabilis]